LAGKRASFRRCPAAAHLFLRLDEGNEGADVVGLVGKIEAGDGWSHQACGVALDDLRVGGRNSALEIGVVAGD
jgi:hypothetical protein